MSDKLTHISHNGQANMVDIGDKENTVRIAHASGKIVMHHDTLKMILAGDNKKGDVLGAARIAGIMAAKKTSDLIPLCHPLALSKITVDIEADENLPGLIVTTSAKLTGKTGVEMEALTACTIACLTIYDMAKAVDRGMQITDIQVDEKSGGKSGHWKNDDSKTMSKTRQGS